VGFEKYITLFKKTIFSPHNDNFLSRELQRTDIKIGEMVSIYHRKLFEKRPSLGTFCTWSLN
jgi:hypothetical protein